VVILLNLAPIPLAVFLTDHYEARVFSFEGSFPYRFFTFSNSFSRASGRLPSRVLLSVFSREFKRIRHTPVRTPHLVIISPQPCLGGPIFLLSIPLHYLSVSPKFPFFSEGCSRQDLWIYGRFRLSGLLDCDFSWHSDTKVNEGQTFNGIYC